MWWAWDRLDDPPLAWRSLLQARSGATRWPFTTITSTLRAEVL